MAKLDPNTLKYIPGYIYELRCQINGEWHPFYVGETHNPDERIRGHRSSSLKDTRLVYNFIRQTLVPNQIEWDLFPVREYGEEGPTDLEDEHIMELLYDGVRLKNMKKGNANWLKEREAEAVEMRQVQIRSYRQYRQYKQARTLEEQQKIADEKQHRWMVEKYARKIQSLEEEVYHGKKYNTLTDMRTWSMRRLHAKRLALLIKKRDLHREWRRNPQLYKPVKFRVRDYSETVNDQIARGRAILRDMQHKDQ